MRHSNRIVTGYLATLFLVAALLAGGGSSEVAQTSPTFTTPLTTNTGLADILGSWTGTWTDTVFNVSGNLNFQVSENAGQYSATGDIDLGLIDFSLGVQSGTANGTVAQNILSFTFQSGMVGNGAGSIDGATNVANGTGSVTAPLSFGSFSFQGTFSSTDMTGSFEFLSPGSGKGIASLTKSSTAVATKPWGEVKDSYRD